MQKASRVLRSVLGGAVGGCFTLFAVPPYVRARRLRAPPADRRRQRWLIRRG